MTSNALDGAPNGNGGNGDSITSTRDHDNRPPLPPALALNTKMTSPISSPSRAGSSWASASDATSPKMKASITFNEVISPFDERGLTQPFDDEQTRSPRTAQSPFTPSHPFPPPARASPQQSHSFTQPSRTRSLLNKFGSLSSARFSRNHSYGVLHEEGDELAPIAESRKAAASYDPLDDSIGIDLSSLESSFPLRNMQYDGNAPARDRSADAAGDSSGAGAQTGNRSPTGYGMSTIVDVSLGQALKPLAPDSLRPGRRTTVLERRATVRDAAQKAAREHGAIMAVPGTLSSLLYLLSHLVRRVDTSGRNHDLYFSISRTTINRFDLGHCWGCPARRSLHIRRTRLCTSSWLSL